MKSIKLAVLVTLAVIVASFALSAQTWIDLARLSGFKHLFHGVPLAWAMPVAVDGYVVMALLLWMGVKDAKLSRFAKINTYVAASLGVVAQSLYHGLSVGQTGGPWFAEPMAFGVGALPPLSAALSIHMLALLVSGGHVSGQRTADTGRTADSGQRTRWAATVAGHRTPSGQTEGIAVRTLSGQRTADSGQVSGHFDVRTADTVRTPVDHTAPVRTSVGGHGHFDVRTADTKPDTDVSGQTSRTADISRSEPVRTADTEPDTEVSGQPAADSVRTGHVVVRTPGQRLDIIEYLSGHPDVSTADVADMFGVTARTVRRYRERMSGQA